MSQHYSREQLERIAKLNAQVGLPFSTSPEIDYFDGKLYRDLWLQENPKLMGFLNRRGWRVEVAQEEPGDPLGCVWNNQKKISFFVGNRVDGLGLGMHQRALRIHHHEIGHALDYELCGGEAFMPSCLDGMVDAMRADAADFPMLQFDHFRYFLTGSKEDQAGLTRKDFETQPFAHHRARKEAFAELYAERQVEDEYMRKQCNTDMLTGYMPRTAQLVDRFASNLDHMFDYCERRDNDVNPIWRDLDLVKALQSDFKGKPTALKQLLAKPRSKRPLAAPQLSQSSKLTAIY